MSRFVLVTGAGKGLGYAVARRHLEAGDRVFALEYQLTDSLLSLQKDFSALTIRKCDLASTGEVSEALQDLAASRASIDILYNIAGIFFESDRVPLEETDIDRCLLLYNVNSLGPLRVMKYALPFLKQGSVVMNVTSEAGSVGDCTRKGEYGYSMSKAACNMASKTFSNQMQGRGIRVFCYHPGWMKTDMGGEGARLSPDAITAGQAAAAVMDIAVRPEQIPENVMYLDYTKSPLNW